MVLALRSEKTEKTFADAEMGRRQSQAVAVDD